VNNNTTIGTHTIVVQVTESAVTFLFIPYGTKNILVLVIGKTAFITITASQAEEISPKIKSIPKNIEIIRGVIITVNKKMLLIHGQ
jgi:hypothetical protein